jgi:histidinol dehydrogenase
MKFIDASAERNLKKLDLLFQRGAYPHDLELGVSKILDELRRNGDNAIAKFAKQFDAVSMRPANFRIKDSEFSNAEKELSPKLKQYIRFAASNVRTFAKMKIPKSWTFSPRKGIILGEKFSPMNRIGVYVPGGAAPLVSTAIHSATLAKIAGVKDIVAVTPPSKKAVNPALLYAMKVAGVTEAYRLGGVYGIGALAYGTKTIAKVEKIVGPGNAFVTIAKKLVYGRVGIDMVAGPSEIMIIADSSANPSFVVADMLSQAEHGSGYEQAVLLTTDIGLAKIATAKIDAYSKRADASAPLKKVIANGVFVILVKNLDTAAKIASEYAPEHLEILCDNAEKIAEKISAAGAIFLGYWSPEAAGDYVAGPSHVLPTGGTAKFFSGLTVEQFFRRTSIIKYSESALKKEASAISAIADIEGLTAHKLSITARCEPALIF